MSDLPPAYSYHYESSAFIAAPAERVFAHVDDHARLSSHMNRSSWMMGGGRMELALDESRGRSVGSRIRVAGRAFGVRLSLEEIVIERTPPLRKVWKTTVSPRLLVIGHYRMGFDIIPDGSGARLQVFIDYSLPGSPAARWLGYLFAGYYARWCTQRMVGDAKKECEPRLSQGNDEQVRVH